jgi:hypothetical protein
MESSEAFFARAEAAGYDQAAIVAAIARETDTTIKAAQVTVSRWRTGTRSISSLAWLWLAEAERRAEAEKKLAELKKILTQT